MDLLNPAKQNRLQSAPQAKLPATKTECRWAKTETLDLSKLGTSIGTSLDSVIRALCKEGYSSVEGLENVYSDSGGTLQLMNPRYESESGEKHHKQASFVNGAWYSGNHWKTGLVLFNIENVTAKPTAGLIFTEGEKACLAMDRLLKSLGVHDWVATCTRGSNPSDLAKHDWSPISGRRCAFLQDNDDAGKRNAYSFCEFVTRHTDAEAINAKNWMTALPGLCTSIDRLIQKHGLSLDKADVADLVGRVPGKLLWDSIRTAIEHEKPWCPPAESTDAERVPDSPVQVPSKDDPVSRRIEQFEIKTVAERLANPKPVEFIVEDVLVLGQNAVIGAPKKSMKTHISMDLAISIASGTPFLGKFTVRLPGRVLFMTGEVGGGTVDETLKAMINSKKCSDDIPLMISERLPKLGNSIDRQALVKLICGEIERFGSINVVIIDPGYASATAGSDARAGDLDSTGRALMTVSEEVIAATGVTLVFDWHAKKNLNPGKVAMDLDDLQGAGIAEWARQWMLINRRCTYNSDGWHNLNLKIGGSAGHASEHVISIFEGKPGEAKEWFVRFETPEEADRRRIEQEAAKNQKRRQTALDALVDLVTNNKDGVSESAGKDAINEAFRKESIKGQLRKNDDTKEFFEDLEARGTVERCEVQVKNGHSGRPVVGWKFIPNTDSVAKDRQLQIE